MRAFKSATVNALCSGGMGIGAGVPIMNFLDKSDWGFIPVGVLIMVSLGAIAGGLIGTLIVGFRELAR